MNAATAAAQNRAAAVRAGRDERLMRATQVHALRSSSAGPAAPAGCRSFSRMRPHFLPARILRCGR